MHNKQTRDVHSASVSRPTMDLQEQVSKLAVSWKRRAIFPFHLDHVIDPAAS